MTNCLIFYERKIGEVEIIPKVGDSIGGIYRVREGGQEIWKLLEGKIKLIVQNSRGTKVYSRGFYPIDLAEIEDNTREMSEAIGWINTRDVVLLTPAIRQKCERWVEWANNNPHDAVSLIGEV